MIKICGMNKTYKGTDFEVKALKDITLTIEDGEFVAIMGESGCGKTTLLNCIGLMDTFDSGEYYLNDTAIHTLPKRKMDGIRKDNISFIFQHYELMRNYTIYENLEIPLLAKNTKRKERKKLILDYAKRLEIDELLTKYPYQISGGQQQRAAIVRAMVADNSVILADEPTGALDSRNSKEFMNHMLMLKELKKTIIMVTHDEKIARYSDRVIYLKDGEIIDS
ncbi:MAG: ABC transporter ATP-binding protein [Lachnospiraceae bacterium]|nr:ABC transporter ATP-binding protein [Lachnospiraceae bacterium]